MTNDTNWLKHYYSGAIGFKIVGATISPDGFPQLVCQKGRGKDREEIVIEVSQDEEGNGAGFLFGLPIPDRKAIEVEKFKAGLEAIHAESSKEGK